MSGLLKYAATSKALKPNQALVKLRFNPKQKKPCSTNKPTQQMGHKDWGKSEKSMVDGLIHQINCQSPVMGLLFNP